MKRVFGRGVARKEASMALPEYRPCKADGTSERLKDGGAVGLAPDEYQAALNLYGVVR